MSFDSVVQVPGCTQPLASFVSSPSEKKEESRSFTLKWLDDRRVDVFRGTGWDNWSRFEKRGNHYKLVSGAPLTPEEYAQLKNG